MKNKSLILSLLFLLCVSVLLCACGNPFAKKGQQAAQTERIEIQYRSECQHTIAKGIQQFHYFLQLQRRKLTFYKSNSNRI